MTAARRVAGWERSHPRVSCRPVHGTRISTAGAQVVARAMAACFTPTHR